MWRAWETLRWDGALGMSNWWSTTSIRI
ncbi:hypothetical protein [Streptomyces sp. NBC_01445]